MPKIIRIGNKDFITGQPLKVKPPKPKKPRTEKQKAHAKRFGESAKACKLKDLKSGTRAFGDCMRGEMAHRVELAGVGKPAGKPTGKRKHR